MSIKSEFLQRIRDEVRTLRGSVTEISNKSGFHRTHVWRVLNGGTVNTEILMVAIQVVKSRQEALVAQEKEMQLEMEALNSMKELSPLTVLHS